MRSYLTTPTIAAFLLASSCGGAFAASAGHDHNGDHGHHHDQPRTPSEDLIRDNAPAPDSTNTGFIVPLSGMHPRLERIVGELNADAARLNADRARGRMTQAAFQRLNTEDATIRSAALAVAQNHDGRIPTANYAALQSQMRHLDWSIKRSA